MAASKYTRREFGDLVKQIIETHHKPYLLKGKKMDIKVVGSNSRLIINHEALTNGGAFEIYLIMADNSHVSLGMQTYKSDPNSSAGENKAWEEVQKKAYRAIKTIFTDSPLQSYKQNH